jgi:hypothetical protein
MKYIVEDVEEAATEFPEEDDDILDYEEWASESYGKAKKYVFSGFTEGEEISEKYIKIA